MRSHIVFRLLPLAFSVAIVAGACSQKPPDERVYPLQGQVQSIDAPRKLVILKHEEIKGFMPAMTMPYEVEDPKVLDTLAPGDLIDSTLVVFSSGARIRNVRKVGTAPLEKPPADPPMPNASSGFELIKPGEAVPDAAFVDQDGRKRHFSGFKGSPVLMTFIYTKCPLPAFCPLMDRHFATMQRTLKEDPALKAVHLVTVSFDPAVDTPPVLKKHAKELDADLSRWTFLTGDRDDIDQFAARFGVSVSRAMNDPRDITHNLRTVIIKADGTLAKVYTGNDWSPTQVLEDLRRLQSGD
ncbi:MAG TPA: SCO family protein [Vicinamibacterales bacterium]|nr:SCO family protein [Vicinamibacterales bacterium]